MESRPGNVIGGDENITEAVDSSFIAWVKGFWTCLKIFFLGREGDIIDVEAALLGLENLFGEDDEVENAEDGQGNNDGWFRRIWYRPVVVADAESVVGAVNEVENTGVPAAVADGVEVGRWNDFVKESNSYIKWLITEVFLFVPARYYLVDQMKGFPNFEEIQLYLPDYFLPTISLYVGFMMGSKIFDIQKIKRIFQAMGIASGVAASVETMIYVEFEAQKYVATTIGVFLAVLIGAKIYERYVSRR